MGMINFHAKYGSVGQRILKLLGGQAFLVKALLTLTF
jgi:hypothetical protein